MEITDLKTCREVRGLSLDDVFQKTRIAIKFLEAIEQANFALLPPAVYTRKFIRDYAQLLGQESEGILRDYDNYLKTVAPPLIVPVGRDNATPPDTTIIGHVLANRWIYASILAGLLAIIIGFLAFSNDGYNWFASIMKIDNSPSTENNRVGQAQTVKNETELAAAGKNVVSTNQLPGQYHLVIEAREVTWLRIRADMNPPYQLLINPGERIERYADQHFVIDIGNAGGVELKFQGKNIGSIGKSGEVVHLRLP